MGTKAKALVGARCKVYVNGVLSGIFTNVSYGQAFGTQPIYILGRANCAEIPYTDMDIVTVTLSGFRVMGNGPHATASVPKLQDILQHEDIVLSIIDRQASDPTMANVMTVTGARPVGFDSTSSARGINDLTVRMQGTILHDESGPEEDPGAVDFG